MKYKFMAVDIDGTLLNSSGQLTEKTVEAVRKAAAAGVVVSLSTGRPLQGVTKFVKALGLEDTPCILYNGALVYYSGEIIYSLTITPSVAEKVVKEGHARNSTMICWANNALYAEADNEKIRFYKSISGVEPIIVDDLSSLKNEGITKFVWYDDEQSTPRYYAEMLAIMGEEIGVYPSRKDFLEFVNKDCSKATAIKSITDRLGIKREEIVAVGDGFNDVPMLEYAGLGVAMGNADDRVKRRADFVTSSCDEDGLASLIENVILK